MERLLFGKNWLILFVIAGLISCVQEEDSAATSIRYTVYVTTQSEQPLDSVRIKIFTESMDSLSVLTGASGQVVIQPIESLVNQFSLSRKGYRSIDSVDVVVVPSDSSGSPETLLRVMRFRMDTIPESE